MRGFGLNYIFLLLNDYKTRLKYHFILSSYFSYDQGKDIKKTQLTCEQGQKCHFHSKETLHKQLIWRLTGLLIGTPGLHVCGSPPCGSNWY